MPRSVNAVARRARRKKIMKQAKGFFGRRKNVWTVAKNAVEKAMQYAYRDRRNKKRTFRALWIVRINAGARLHGLSYSQFMGKLKANNIELSSRCSDQPRCAARTSGSFMPLSNGCGRRSWPYGGATCASEGSSCNCEVWEEWPLEPPAWSCSPRGESSSRRLHAPAWSR